jgi:hypothetical protein
MPFIPDKEYQKQQVKPKATGFIPDEEYQKPPVQAAPVSAPEIPPQTAPFQRQEDSGRPKGILPPEEFEKRFRGAFSAADEQLQRPYMQPWQPFMEAFDIPERTATPMMESFKRGLKGLTTLARPEEREKGLIRGGLLTGLGALETLGAPLDAPVKGLVGQPVEDILTHHPVTEDMPDIAKKAIRFGVELPAYFMAPGMIAGKAPQAAKEVKKGLEALKKMGLADDVADVPLQHPLFKGLSKTSKEAFPAAPKAYKATISDDMTKKIAEAADLARIGQADKSKRVFQRVADELAVGGIQIEDVDRVLKAYKLTPEQFAQHYRETYSMAGKQMQQLSVVARRLNKLFKNDPKASKAFDELAREATDSLTGPEKVADFIVRNWYKIEDQRRMLLTAQMATAMRNLWSQAGRVSIGAIDNAMQGVITGAMGAPGGLKRSQAGLYTPLAIINRFRPEKRKQLAKILDEGGDAIEKAKLMSAPVHEVTAGHKFSKVLQAMNRAQEGFFRKLAFESKLREQLKLRGKILEGIDPKDISHNEIAKAVDYAHEMTFARTPKGLGGEVIRMWSKIPGLTLVNPFPRFNFGNAIPFLVEHSPAGWMFAMSPKTLKALSQGKPEQFAKAASRAMIGQTMLELALRLRTSEKYAGDEWYDINVGKKKIDMRGFAPLSTYLFLAEVLTKPENIKFMDYAQAIVGLQRIAGTGLVLTDMLRTDKPESTQEGFKRFIGQYGGSATVPMRTFKDFASAIDPEEAKYRDERERPFTGPAMQNIPRLAVEKSGIPALQEFHSQMLPERPSPTQAETGRAEHPVIRQLTGLSIRTKNKIEQEFDRLGIDRARIYPRTGIPEADNLIIREMGPVAEKAIPKLMKKKRYKDAPIKDEQEYQLLNAFEEIRAAATEKVKSKHPDLRILLKKERMPDTLMNILKYRKPERAAELEQMGEERRLRGEEERRKKSRSAPGIGELIKRKYEEIRYGGR